MPLTHSTAALAACCLLAVGCEDQTRRAVRASGRHDAGSDMVPDSGPGDGGLDAGMDLDAGPDAGGSVDLDAGPALDAGPDLDSGPRDSGPADSGPGDSGPRDSGPVDSGPVDSGPRDAGPQDSGPSDSGPGDAGPSACADDFQQSRIKALPQVPLDGAWTGSGWAAAVYEIVHDDFYCCWLGDSWKVSTAIASPSGDIASLGVGLMCDCAFFFNPLGAQPAAVAAIGSGRSLMVVAQPAGIIFSGNVTWAFLVDSDGETVASVQISAIAEDYLTLAHGSGTNNVACWIHDQTADPGDEIVCRQVSASGTLLTLGTTAQVVVRSGPQERGAANPAIAYGSTTYGLAYGKVIIRPDGSTDSDLWFTRVDSTASRVLGSDLEVAATAGWESHPHLAAGGGGYGLAWMHEEGGVHSIRFARLTADGLVTDAPLTLGTAGAADPFTLARVAWIDSGWTIAWSDGVDLFLARVSGSGALTSSQWLSTEAAGSAPRAFNTASPARLLFDGADGTYVGSITCP